jgi:hypothetical protein
VVCWGGGLNKYQTAAADALQRPLRARFQARVAETPDGSLIGVHAPLAEHEQPIIRTYLEVEDITRTVKEAEAAGAVIAYPHTQQGNTGTWAIYFLGNVKIGLWQP